MGFFEILFYLNHVQIENADYLMNNLFRVFVVQVICPVLDNPTVCREQSVRPDIAFLPE
jgi:hypothetical protein